MLRAHRAVFALSLVLLAGGAFVPHAHAAFSTLHWNYYFDQAAGTVNQNADVLITDGGTFSVPLNAPGKTNIQTSLPPQEEGNYFGAAQLFFINPDTGEREALGKVRRSLTWAQAGTYELDVYADLVVVTQAPVNRLFAWLVPTAHAQTTDNPFHRYIETIRFTIVDGPIPPPPCCSSVLFLPGIKGSALKEGEDTLWPASVWSRDIDRLALDENGESVNQIIVAGVLSNFYTTDVYGGFATYMDSLTDDSGDGTIREWKPFAYDWRFSPEKILTEGVATPEGTVDLVQTLEELASNSKSGKVTIIAHSMGGLMGKALIQELVNRGEESLVDSFVMVGTPQLGTPQGASSLLHGDEEGILGGVIVDASDVREVAQGMESAYNLLPSARYFTDVTDPVITFDSSASYADAWKSRWGSSIDSFSEFSEFITGTGVPRTHPSASNLVAPEVLRSDVAASTAAFHETYDDFDFPNTIRVVQVAGWGVPTVKSIEYETKYHFLPGYQIHTTSEGDRTVVYPSAVSSNTEDTYFFDLASYNALESTPDYEHRNLLSAPPVQNTIEAVLKNGPILNSYIAKTKPLPGSLTEKLLVSTHSPVLLGVHDNHGNFTGIKPDQNPFSGFLLVDEGIPGSTFLASGGNQFVFLPKQGSYTFKFEGTASGPATVEVGNVSNDTVTPISTYTDIPVTSNTEASFIVNTDAPQGTAIAVDKDGNGTTDVSITPDGYVPPSPSTPTFEELISTLKVKIQSLSTTVKLKTNLLKKIENIEKKIEKQKQKKSKVLDNLLNQIAKKAGKGKIDTESAAEITTLLNELETHSGTFPLDANLLQQLWDKIGVLSAKPALKETLLKRITRLEETVVLSRTLARLTETVAKKGMQGKITDVDLQEILELLNVIENAL